MAAESKPTRNKSAMKRAKQNEARALHNRSEKNRIKTLIKQLEKAVTDKNVDAAGTTFTLLISAFGLSPPFFLLIVFCSLKSLSSSR